MCQKNLYQQPAVCIASVLDVDDYAIMLHIPLTPYILTVHSTDHRASPTARTCVLPVVCGGTVGQLLICSQLAVAAKTGDWIY